MRFRGLQCRLVFWGGGCEVQWWCRCWWWWWGVSLVTWVVVSSQGGTRKQSCHCDLLVKSENEGEKKEKNVDNERHRSN